MQPIAFISAFALDEDGQEGFDKWARERRPLVGDVGAVEEGVDARADVANTASSLKPAILVCTSKVVVDAQRADGTRLYFRVDDHLPSYVDVAFPPGTALRAWALLGLSNALGTEPSPGEPVPFDRVRISGWVRCPTSD